MPHHIELDKNARHLHSLMKKHRCAFVKWFFVILFVAYTGGITLFTHTHVINAIAYTHSHPYKKSEKKQHSHTEKQLVILDFLFNQSITSDILSDAVAEKPGYSGFLFFGEKDDAHIPLLFHHNTQLRAPPAA